MKTVPEDTMQYLPNNTNSNNQSWVNDHNNDDQSWLQDNDSPVVQETSTFLEIDYQTANNILHNSPPLSNLTPDGHRRVDFSNDISNTYFDQEFRLYHEEGEMFGGIRGVCWRSRYRLDLDGVHNINTLADTKYMFDITKLVSTNTKPLNKLLYRVLKETIEQMDGDFDSLNRHVKIPKCEADAQRNCISG